MKSIRFDRGRIFLSLTVASSIGVIVGLGIVGGGGGGFRSSVSVANAQQFLAQSIPDELPIAAGKTLHVKTEVYQRHGPSSDEIEDLPGAGPERTVRESWSEIGQNETVLKSYATIRDDSGTIVQEAVFSPDGIVSRDPRQVEVIREAPWTGPKKANAFLERAERYESLLSSGDAVPIAQSENELVLEIRTPVDDVPDLSIPYVNDLSPQASIRRVSIRNDGVVTVSEVYVETESGEEVLVQSERMLDFEALDEFPSGLIGETP